MSVADTGRCWLESRLVDSKKLPKIGRGSTVDNIIIIIMYYITATNDARTLNALK